MSSSLLVLPSALRVDGRTSIPAPSEASFILELGAHLPPAQFLKSSFGTTAVYDFPASQIDANTPSQHILFVHGLGTCALGLLPLANAIRAGSPHAHLVLYDNWGHGLSSTPLLPHVPGLFHFQMLSVLAKMNWTKAHIMGYSFGGSTVASFTKFHPERVESLTLLAPAGLIKFDELTFEQKGFMRGGTGVNEQAARDWAVDFASGGPLKIAENWKERFARGDIFSGDPIQAWERSEHRGHLASFTGIVREGGIFGQEEVFAAAIKSGIPNLAVLGELDDLCTAEDLRKLGWSNVVVVKQAGHAVIREQVNEVAAPILSLLRGLAVVPVLSGLTLDK